LGLISINTAIEADIYGNINSTHIGGTKMMNGIGGSGDFTRNAFISIFTCPSVAKDGKISPLFLWFLTKTTASTRKHLNYRTRSCRLRGKSPLKELKPSLRTVLTPDYKEILWDYMKLSGKGQTPHCVQPLGHACSTQSHGRYEKCKLG
jgi:acyl-CoA hydrolase